jgi:hypothetical protein
MTFMIQGSGRLRFIGQSLPAQYRFNNHRNRASQHAPLSMISNACEANETFNSP